MWLFRKKTKKYFYVIPIIVGVVGLIVGWLATQFFLANQGQDNFDNHFEVTFMEPQTAIIFWHSPEPGIGYVQYGANKTKLSEKASQTSSQPTIVHAVIIDQVPPEGIFLTTHTEEESRFKFSKPIHIQYDSSIDQPETEELTP